MRKISICVIISLFCTQLSLWAQTESTAITIIKEEQQRFLQHLKSTSMDSAMVHSIAGYCESTIKNISTSISSNDALSLLEKEKAARSLVFLLKELGKNLDQQQATIYDIPGALQSYEAILKAVLAHQPLNQLLTPLRSRRSELLTAAFTQYNEHAVLDNNAVYKRMSSSPQFILQFLENKPGFCYADSLLLEAAAYDPMKLVFYLNSNKPGLQEKVRNTKNIYLQQIVSISEDKNASELLPFVKQIAEKKITPEEIIEKRTDAVSYFQLLVNTLQESKSPKDASCIFLKPLRNGIKQKALAFYAKPINDQHSSADAVRFASVKKLRPEDLYYIITSCGEDLYTSSYLGLYKRLMASFANQQADSLFDIVQYDNFRIFMRLAANYNVLPDFLHNMPAEKMQQLVKRFITGIETDTDTGLEIAMDIGDSFISLGASPEIGSLIQNELQANLNRCNSSRQYVGIRLYSILLQVFDMVRKEHKLDKLWATLGNYEVLKRDELQNSRGEIIQLVLFYGDDDGVSSFNNFLKQYADAGKWEIIKNENWVSIRSLSSQPVIIYANMPLDSKDEMDLKAQDSLFAYLQEQSLEPTVLVHRGHSYHLDQTLKRLTPSVRLAILGSCGGYNKAISIATINPDVQIIGSKKTGAMSINDPIIEVINETLVSQQDLLWPEIWKNLGARFSKNEGTLTLFNEYFPPSNNISLFVLKLFNYYNRFA